MKSLQILLLFVWCAVLYGLELNPYCEDFIKNGEFVYCKSNVNIGPYLACPKDTYFTSYIVNKTLECLPCETGTRNPLKYHINKVCTYRYCMEHAEVGDQIFCIPLNLYAMMCPRNTKWTGWLYYAGSGTEILEMECIGCESGFVNARDSHANKECSPENEPKTTTEVNNRSSRELVASSVMTLVVLSLYLLLCP